MSLVNDALLENKYVTIWPDYPCLYGVRSVDFRNSDLRQRAIEAIGEQLDQTSAYFENVMLSVRHLSDGIARIKTFLNIIS